MGREFYSKEQRKDERIMLHQGGDGFYAQQHHFLRVYRGMRFGDEFHVRKRNPEISL